MKMAYFVQFDVLNFSTVGIYISGFIELVEARFKKRLPRENPEGFLSTSKL